VIAERPGDKVTADHLRRDAYVYVRQSTLRQVAQNTTSTDRQYGLPQSAIALGWKRDQIIVIDEDLGRSGASSQGRDGFQRLVADVGMGKAGIVIGTEVSRLARNNALCRYRHKAFCSASRFMPRRAPRSKPAGVSEPAESA
jgi:hypothetical protein